MNLATPFDASQIFVPRWALAVLIGLSCCGPATGPPRQVAVAGPAVPVAVGSVALPPATSEELAVTERLRATVRHLSVDIGERNGSKQWSLASATDDLALALEKMGYSVRRQGFESGDQVVQNLDVTVSGGDLGKETLVVGAHFDTAPGTPGADDDASGVAGVLELARSFRDRKPRRTIRFALFTNAEEPHFRTEQMGSLVFAKRLVADDVEVVGMLCLDGIGVYSALPGSQRYPEALAAGQSRTADFLSITANEASRAFLERTTLAMKRHASLPVVGEVLAPELPGVGNSDHWSFWSVGVPAVLMTDTAGFRYPHHHRMTDLPEHLDFERMARAVVGLGKTLEEIAN